MRQNLEKYAARFGKKCDFTREKCGKFCRKYGNIVTPFNTKENKKYTQFLLLKCRIYMISFLFLPETFLQTAVNPKYSCKSLQSWCNRKAGTGWFSEELAKRGQKCDFMQKYALNNKICANMRKTEKNAKYAGNWQKCDFLHKNAFA